MYCRELVLCFHSLRLIRAAKCRVPVSRFRDTATLKSSATATVSTCCRMAIVRYSVIPCWYRANRTCPPTARFDSSISLVRCSAAMRVKSMNSMSPPVNLPSQPLSG
ncbi:hypothetical protein D3C77_561530 [compost metagenome]